MRVLCINGKGWMVFRRFLGFKLPKNAAGPKYEDICHVVNSEYAEGELFYYFEEWGDEGPFQAKFFIPLSNIDEVEIAKERRKPVYY